MIHGSQLLEASKNAGQVLAIVTAGLKIGDVHLRLDRADAFAEFIFRAKVNDQMRGAQFCVRLEELVLTVNIEGLAHRVLAQFDRAARAGS